MHGSPSDRGHAPGATRSGNGGQDDDLASEGAVRGPGVHGPEVGHRHALGDVDDELTPVDPRGELGQLCGVAADEQVDAAHAACLVGRGGHPHGGVDDDPAVADDARESGELVRADGGRLFNAAIQANLRETTTRVLASLTPREERVLRMRFGIGMNTDHTLEEVGQQFSVTRERIRQIEAKALRKLKHPSRSRKLRSFLDT